MPVAPHNDRITLTFTRTEMARLKTLAKKRGLTVSKLIAYELRDKGII